MPTEKVVRLILGDQLNPNHSWFAAPSNEAHWYVMMEQLSETNYVRHHVQKVVGFFLAMRHFAEHLQAQGKNVLYLQLDDPRNRQQFADNLSWIVQELGATRLEYQLPDEYRLDQILKRLADQLPVPVTAVDTEHFLSERQTVKELFKGKKQYLMETFYRAMRKKYAILMEPDGKNPLSGRWNYDAENRKKMPEHVAIPPISEPDPQPIGEIVALLEKMEVQTIGAIDAQRFIWPVTPQGAEVILDDFLRHRLRSFGDFQDALTSRDPFLFHSRLSFALNTKLLHPMKVIQKTLEVWDNGGSGISLATVEGFIRQILGWREFVRGIYWAEMPEYGALNFFAHGAALPDFYWTGNTRMACMKQAIGQSLDHAYAHHIQRLMVTGNFALLLGVHPDAVDAWYLGIYIDALEWVEMPNTRGMSQFADGGIVGTKPYVSSANYIHKMGDHCSQCYYQHKEKIGPKACPFNSLYWDFYHRHREKLEKKPRIGMMYRVWDKMSPEDRQQLLAQAAYVKSNSESL